MFTALFSGSVCGFYLAAAFLPFITTFVNIFLSKIKWTLNFNLFQSLGVGLSLSLALAIVAIVGHILTKPYSYPFLAMNTTNCPNETANFTIQWNQRALENAQDPDANWLFSLGFPYFAPFTLLVCLSTAIAISLISIPLRKYGNFGANFNKILSPPSDIDSNLLFVLLRKKNDKKSNETQKK